MTAEYITLKQAKDHLGLEESFTYHDDRVADCIGAAIDWAEDYTQRSLGQLLQLDSPRDSTATAVDEKFLTTASEWGSGYDWTLEYSAWPPQQFRCYWAAYLQRYPAMNDQSQSLRRNVRQAILIKMEQMFDRDPSVYKDLEDACTNLIFPYRIAMGV